LLGSTEAGFGALMGSFELPEASHCRGALGVHLGAVEVISFAVVASLGPQSLDPLRVSHYNPRVRAFTAEISRDWVGLRASAQLADALVVADRAAMDGILGSFGHQLEMLGARVARLQRALGTDVRL
jgi:hypothetical protein